MIFKTNYSKIKLLNAGVAKLADALDLGSSGKTVQVQVLSPAPVAAGSLTAASPVAIAGLQENLGGAFAAAAESTALHGAALMTGGNNCSYFLSSYFYAYCCRRNSWGFIKILICRKATT